MGGSREIAGPGTRGEAGVSGVRFGRSEGELASIAEGPWEKKRLGIVVEGAFGSGRCDCVRVDGQRDGVAALGVQGQGQGREKGGEGVP